MIKILKYIGIIPLQIFVWFAQYLVVAPIQFISQAILTWGAKKAFIETKVIRNIMENIKKTQFQDTPYVPVLDFLAQKLIDIHQAQQANQSPDTGNYKSDEENRRKIKAFLDRTFRFIRIWNTNSREEIKAIMTSPSGFSGEIQNVIKGALTPVIQNTLVDLIETVQSLATEESQLESFLFQICEIADEALCNEGKTLTQDEKKKRTDGYKETQKVIETHLNAILWTVCLESTSEIGKSGTVKVAKDHIAWLKTAFLGESQTSSTNSIEIDDDDDSERGAFVLDTNSTEIGDDDESVSSVFSFLNSQTLDDSNERDTKIGHIKYWKEALNTFLENPNEKGSSLTQAYLSCRDLLELFKEKEVEINSQQIAGTVTRQHLQKKSNTVLESLQTVFDQFHNLHTLYLYHQYTENSNKDNATYPINTAIECVNLLKDFKNNINNHSNLIVYLKTLDEKQKELLVNSNIPLELSSLKTDIDAIITDFNKDSSNLTGVIDNRILKNINNRILKNEVIMNHIEKSKRIFNEKKRLCQEISKMMNSLTSLETVVNEISYIDFLEIDFPSSLKTMGHLITSSIQQTLFQAMSSCSKILINAVCNADVFEIFIRNIAIRPLVESVRGVKRIDN